MSSPLGDTTLVLLVARSLESLANLYAIGVVGAITLNLGSCTINKTLGLKVWERIVMGGTFLILVAVEITIAKTKPDALFFAVCIMGFGLGPRAYGQRRAGLRTVTVSEEVAAHVSPGPLPTLKLNLTPRPVDHGRRPWHYARVEVRDGGNVVEARDVLRSFCERAGGDFAGSVGGDVPSALAGRSEGGANHVRNAGTRRAE